MVDKFSSERYWLGRYAGPDPGGWGSKGELAEWKAEYINRFVHEHGVTSILELGCGDGEQLALYDFEGIAYAGLDVITAVQDAEARFAGREGMLFGTLGELEGVGADLTMSVDVIYHLVEDEVYEAHMARLFDSARRFVLIYSSDREETPGDAGVHCRTRAFTAWVKRRPEWKLMEREPNRYPWSPKNPHGSLSEFFVYGRR